MTLFRIFQRLAVLALTAAVMTTGLVHAQDVTEAPNCAEGYRLIEHAMGASCVVEHPQRIVVLDAFELDAALSLGVKPVGAVEASAGEGFLAYLAPLTDGIQVVGTIAEPNLEAILALKPDLILSSKPRHEDIYPQLAAIAPTVFSPELARTKWKDFLGLYAKALNREDVLALRLAEYQARIDVVRSAIPVADTQVSILRFVPSEIRLMQRGSFIGSVLDDVGFPRPESQQSAEFKLAISAEQVNLADVLFYTSFGDPGANGFNAVTESPLFQSLNAVKNHHAYIVDDDHWFLGTGLLGANRIMDDLLLMLGRQTSS